MLTVLLATRNRASILQQTLDAFCRLQEPESGWRLVVVDNGSTDRTPEVLALFTPRLPLRALSETKGGKNSSLNTGLGSAEGDLIVFTDDDVFPRPDWLLELQKATLAQPTYSMFTGAIVPRCESPPPPNVAELLVSEPVDSVTMTAKLDPLSALAVGGVV